MQDEDYGTILLDVTPGAEGEFDADLLRRWGHHVTVCHGPHEGTLCPLLAGTGCAKFDSAHGVVFHLDLDRPQHRAILRRYRELASEDIPIRAIVTDEQRERYHDELDGVELWTHEPTVAELDGFAAEVEAAERV